MFGRFFSICCGLFGLALTWQAGWLYSPRWHIWAWVGVLFYVWMLYDGFRTPPDKRGGSRRV